VALPSTVAVHAPLLTHTHTHCNSAAKVSFFQGIFTGGKKFVTVGHVLPKKTCYQCGGQQFIGYLDYSLTCNILHVPSGELTLNAGLGNLWHVERFPWHVAFTADPIFFLFYPTSISILLRMCTHTCIWLWTVYELLLLPNDTANAALLHKPGVMPSLHWVFITGALAWQWQGNYVTLDKRIYNLLF